MHILSAPLTGLANGRELPQQYRAIVKMGDLGPVLQVQEYITDPESREVLGTDWSGTPGCWYLETLADFNHDVIAIDFGQAWDVRGIQGALREAFAYIENELAGE